MPEGKSNTGLAFILGAVVVVLGAVIWYLSGGEVPGESDADITIDVPGVEIQD